MKYLLTLFYILTSLILNAQLISDGLIGYYPMDGNVEDMSVHQNHGIASSGVISDLNRHEVSDRSMYFDIKTLNALNKSVNTLEINMTIAHDFITSCTNSSYQLEND